MPVFPLRVGVRCLAYLLLIGSSVAGATLSVQERLFVLDGRPFDMWGIRVAGASQSAALTEHLIDQLDTYRRHGVNTVSVYYMGCAAIYEDPFSPDGREIDAAHRHRMESIIREADRRGMVVIVGVFYQRSNAPQLKDWDAAHTAVATVARSLRPYRNVILNLANEQNSARYTRLPWARVTNTDDIVALARTARAAAPGLIVGAGGYDDDKNEIIGRAPEIDVLLFDTNGPENSGELFRRFRRAGVDKPMVNVETFGAWTSRFVPRGVFPEEVKRRYQAEIDAAAENPGLYVHFHNSPWCQPDPKVGECRYDLGGRGTEASPGIRWYFEAVREKTAGNKPARE